MTESERLLCQVASYNTNLQGSSGLPQDLVDWLSPTLTVSNFLSREPRGPDVVAVGFQELLPLHLACKNVRAFDVVFFIMPMLLLQLLGCHAPSWIHGRR